MERRRKIVVDSSSNLNPDYIKDAKVGFQVVPLTIRIDDKDFVDEEKTDANEMLSALHACKGRTTTSCPSPEMFSKAYEDADDIIVVTISGKLSGSTNAAYVGSLDMEGKRVHVIDSQEVSGGQILIVDKALELLKTDMSFEEIEDKLDEFANNGRLLFVLDSFEMLYKAGRVSKVLAFLGATLHLKGICMAQKGEIKLYKKAHGMKKGLLEMTNDIGETCSDISSRDCIVSCTGDDPNGQKVVDSIKEKYNFRSVRLVKHRILCSYYALEGGIIVSF